MKIRFLYLLTALTIVLSSCGDDDEDKTGFTPDEAKQSMSTLSNEMTTDVVDLTQAEGMDAVGDLFGLLTLNDPFQGRMDGSNKQWFKKNISLFKTLFIPKSAGFERTEAGFDFEGHWGEYNWDSNTEEFVKSSATVEMIIINFPAEGSATNNVTLRITDYAEQQFSDQFDTWYNPTLLAADLSIDDVEQITLDLSVSYNDLGDPVAGNVVLFLNPFTFTVTFDDTQSTASSGSASIKKGTETVVAVDVLVAFLNAEKEDVDDVSGFVQYRHVKIEGSIDVDGIDNAQDPDPNQFVNLAMFDNGNKIGDIIFITEMVDGYEEDVPYVEYTDGSKEKLEDILKPVIDEIDAFVENEVDTWSIG